MDDLFHEVGVEIGRSDADAGARGGRDERPRGHARLLGAGGRRAAGRRAAAPADGPAPPRGRARSESPTLAPAPSTTDVISCSFQLFPIFQLVFEILI